MDLTYIARGSDGLVLCESWATGSEMSGRKSIARQILKKIGRARSQQRGSIDCGDGYFWHYLVDMGISYMTLCPKNFNRKAAFVFLDDIASDFQEELKLEFGTGSTDYMSKIETVERPYYFVKFDRTIQKRKRELRDPESSGALQKLNESLAEVHSIMKENVNEILQRGEDLMQVGEKAENLKITSSQFARQAKYLSFQALLQQYLPIVTVSAVVLLVLGYKFLL